MANRAAGLNALFKMATGAENAAPAVKPAAKKAALTEMGGPDDWGWKGGKPGEVTGADFDSAREILRSYNPPEDDLMWANNVMRSADKQVASLVKAKPNTEIVQNKQVFDKDWLNQIGYQGEKNRQRSAKHSVTISTMDNFKHLEDANIPREWTGKVLNATKGRLMSPGEVFSTYVQRQQYANSISDAMRGLYVPNNPKLTKDYRETFVTLLPDWTGTIDELAAAARAL